MPGGTAFQFDVGASTTVDIIDQSGAEFKLPSGQSLAPEAIIDVALHYYLQISMLGNWIVELNGNNYSVSQENPALSVLILQ